MVFSSPLFLFLFLPLCLALTFAAGARFRNGILLGASVVYYGFGEWRFLPIVLGSVLLNYLLGLAVGRFRGGRYAPAMLAAAVVLNLGLLAWFKYANFFAGIANQAGGLVGHPAWVTLAPIALPLGISFFTFHALSYVIDIYRGDAPAQRSPSRLALYILFFPQLVAGPIVRYHEIAEQLVSRVVTVADFAAGVERFTIGLGKKMLIANSVAEIADAVYGMPADQLTCPLAWLGTLAYALQIYFDFSGYSDMAVGLARMFGFRFPENFNYPYVARSITDFWRRWHMSLSRFFRDYLYIPLGGNRVSSGRVYLNLVLVFFLCGLWHGASWNFVVWGLLHGLFLVLERIGGRTVLERTWTPVQHAYTLLVVLVTWVFFRADSLSTALQMLTAMAGAGAPASATTQAALYLDNERMLALVAGLAAATPVLRRRSPTQAESWGWQVGRVAGLLLIFLASAMRLSSGTYNPFIYFRF